MSEETNKLIEEKVEELYNSLMEKPLRVLDIFNDFFGEQLVDMQGCIDFEEFKSYFNTIPINAYAFNIMSTEELIKYNCMTIGGLPTHQVTKVINNLQNVKEIISSLLPSNIFILVHFPHVRVTNENNRYVDINHLWAKVKVSYDGTLNGGFTLNRSEYTMLHMNSDYMHSHISHIPKNDFTEFQNPCTGNGPINGTITALNRDYDEDIWNMFCLELSKYVTVESIDGIPYHYLEKLGTNNMKADSNRFVICTSPCPHGCILHTDELKEFIKYFISQRKLKFNYVEGSYSIGMSFIEYIILISNEFISWYNRLFNEGVFTKTFNELEGSGLLNKCIIDNGKIYYRTDIDNIDNCLSYIGEKVCIFKGREITIDIIDAIKARDENKNIILNTQTALYILNIILKVLNYRYGRETNPEGNQIGTKVRYL